MRAVAEATAGADDEPRFAAGTMHDASSEVITHPRGAGFGQAFHELLEEVAFDAWPGVGEALTHAQREAVERKLRDHAVGVTDAEGADTAVKATARLLGATLYAPLPEIGPLAAVPEAHRAAEIEFFIRLGEARASRVLDRIAEAGYAGARGTTALASMRGLMHGFIDLVVEHEGQFWILDYKTNALGPMRADYAPERLDAAMIEHHYDLQYLIYTVALHRHLRQRLADYDPAVHLGGVLYLFVRGLDDGAQNGVFHDRPDPGLIETLDALLDGSEAA
jgi:exodeoxyribonuclease V beta subunit